MDDNFLVPQVAILFVVLLVFGVPVVLGLVMQRNALSRQRQGMDRVEESLDMSRRNLEIQEELLEVARRSLALQEETVRLLRGEAAADRVRPAQGG